ncbi:small GTP-binding protein [Histomonas meleagridis]|uniref:small GTP-binding protein n=1 Tax=Histomonas meleagridis TaxID=135588 RepID=UPI00355AC0E2|nr:small GTP-binding protein [Histomonas meleagridis]KAH0803821.1 small GTP-binding protein [Histomonas meleagridis]
MADGEIQHFKIVLLGDTETGKTSLVNKWMMGVYSTNEKQTVGCDHLRKRLILDTYGPIDVHIWDTAGQDYQSLMPIYAKGASFVIIVASITNRDSFASIQRWVNIVKENCKKLPPMALAVNKTDKTDSFVFTENEIHASYDGVFENIFFVSAHSGDNVDKLFSFAAIESVKFTGSPCDTQQQEQTEQDSQKRKCIIS